MNPLLSKLSPNATKQIRMDHTSVLAVFHKYHADSPANIKQGLVDQACMALEIHAQLEEEIFYPALRAISTDSEVLAKSVPEHDEMRRLIAQLRSMEPTDPDYDRTFMELMRDVVHHVADEETVLLPAAEKLLADQLDDIGARMTERRMEIGGPRMGEFASNVVRGMPASTMLMTAGGLIASGYLLKRAFERRS
ncbi:hemerythrin domain-containing protein [Caldimonas tepidiphila]|uniref:hemerythrin domain-containing protein n=1 Tax=Caldimonas tepidiphila TaxID=2315841 RepID=UPI000E5BDEF5|nr:hemerythrin domain-containing protein [Caldimonas tepidiphila]